MNRRTLTAAAAALAATIGAAACDPADTIAQGAPASASRRAAQCTPRINGTGITVNHGTVTGTLTLHCADVPSFPLVDLHLFYRPNTRVGTSDAGHADSSTYAASYSVTAACKAGLWYLGAVTDTSDISAAPDPQHGATLTLTAADCA